MSFIIAEVHDELFQGWLKETKNNFHLMLETMIRVADLIKDKVQTKYSPIRTGKLSKSFKEFVITDNSRMKVVEIQMRALNERTGFDYAEVQHRGYHITKSGRYARYKYGSKDLGFFNYTTHTGLNGGDFETSPNYQVSVTHHGGKEYMYLGIITTRSDAYEMIETDYLSMFQGGFIV